MKAEHLKHKQHKPMTPREWDLFVKVCGIMLGQYGKEARQTLLDTAKAMKKARSLRRKGYYVKKPKPRLSRPQLLIIERGK